MAEEGSDWIDRACRRLLSWQTSAGGFGYRPEASPYVEPTALAVLALGAARERHGMEADRAARSAARWLTTLQQPDGSVGLSEAHPQPAWGTALATLAWRSVDDHAAERSAALAWLANQRGVQIEDPDGVSGHDDSIEGWPWVDATSPWLEPTAWAVLALDDLASARERVRHGVDLLLDRAVPGGGWNYGNTTVLGTTLHARPAPSGLALMALASQDVSEEARIVAGLEFLASALPATRAPQSLGLGLLGWSAWRRPLADGARWLRESFDVTLERPDPVLQTVYLLLAAIPATLGLLGASRPEARA